MSPTKRIFINTLTHHVRSIVYICLSLYSTRLVLHALGESDYGVFSLVAGVVALLGFLTNAMVVTTQRQLSFLHGKGDLNHVRRMFSNSLLLHLLFGLIIVIILCAIEPLLFNGFLKIDAARTPTATKVYYLVILSLFITFLAAPYRALFIARENIVYISIVDVLDGIFKLFFAIWLLTYGADRLIAYAWTTVAIMMFNYLAFALWAHTHFEESVLLPHRSDINRQDIRELTGFAGWTIYSMGCIIGRTQGVTIILNKFFGTAINAAYGIAQHVFAAVMFVSQAIVNAMSPQLIKAEGRGDRQHMLQLSEALSKYSFLLLSLIVIPMAFEMPAILQIWLDEVPDYTIMLCRFILITALCDQTTIGLNTANQAVGKIRIFSLTVNTTKVLTLPVFWLILSQGYPVEAAMWCYLLFEIACAFIRFPILKYTAGLSIRHFVAHVFLRILIPTAGAITICWIIVNFVNSPYRILLTTTASVCTSIVFIWLFALEQPERTKVLQYIQRHLRLNHADTL